MVMPQRRASACTSAYAFSESGKCPTSSALGQVAASVRPYLGTHISDNDTDNDNVNDTDADADAVGGHTPAVSVVLNG